MLHVYYIVPAETDLAGQCRIVHREVFDGEKFTEARRDYQANPGTWKDVGLMSSRGAIRCLTAPKDIYEDVRASEPLMAGTEFRYYGEPET